MLRELGILVSGGFNLAAKTQLASGIAGRAPLNEAELSDRLAVPQARMDSVTLKSLSEAGHGGNPSDPPDPRKDH